MAYLDSNTIVLDAVLTPFGRQQLAAGQLKVAKFALFDDEVDYSLFDANALYGQTDSKITALPLIEAVPTMTPRYFLTDVDPREVTVVTPTQVNESL